MIQTSEITPEQRLLRPALCLEGVKTSFRSREEGRFTLGEITLTLPRGYILGIIGRNGAGKSTLLRLIMQNVKREKGRILVAGYPMDTHAAKAKQLIGYVGEDFHLIRKATILENGRLLGGFFQSYEETKYRELLNRLEIGENKLGRDLSKGEIMKVQLAFALSHQPELLLLDEPTGGLDPLIRREVLSLLQEELFSEKMGIIFSTHITDDLDKIADYIAMIEQGKLLFCETKEELYERMTDENGERITLKQLMINYCRRNER